jgi:hypothetical protein
VTAGIISLIALTIASRRHRRLPVIARWSWLLLLVETVTALATLPLMYLGVLLGVVERVQVAMISIWLFVIAGQLYTDRRRRAVPPVRAPRSGPAVWDGSAGPRHTPGEPQGGPDDGTWEEAART